MQLAFESYGSNKKLISKAFQTNSNINMILYRMKEKQLSNIVDIFALVCQKLYIVAARLTRTLVAMKGFFDLPRFLPNNEGFCVTKSNGSLTRKKLALLKASASD